jgi:peptidoglycan/xylan/chitin deacetylase (PgdA/CDA1 family)
MYHHIRDYAALDDPAARNLSVSPAELRSQMQYIRDQNYRVITTEDIHDGTVPCRSIMLTFDDGYADIYSDAFPILQEYDFR